MFNWAGSRPAIYLIEVKLFVTIEEVKGSIPGYVDYGTDDANLKRMIERAHILLEERLQCPLTDYVDEKGNLNAALRDAIIVKVVTRFDTPSELSFSRPYNTGIVEESITPFIKFRGRTV